jgi:hypothetical protein
MINTDVQILNYIIKYCLLINSSIKKYENKLDIFFDDFDHKNSRYFYILQCIIIYYFIQRC